MLKHEEPVWIKPQEWHTEERPFCRWRNCACHFDHDRVERHFVQPIERHEIDIPAGLARYYDREEEVSPVHTPTATHAVPSHVLLVNELIDPATPIHFLSKTLYTLELTPEPAPPAVEGALDATEKRPAVQVYVDHARIPPISPLLLEHERLEREREVA